MTKLDLKDKLTRKMVSGDLCHQRIFSCIPSLWYMYSEYMTRTKIYDFAEVFFLLILDWNGDKNYKIIQRYGSKKIDLAINEVLELYDIISEIYDCYLKKNYSSTETFEKLLKVNLKNYQDISMLCNIYLGTENHSKLITRKNTIVKKAKKTLNGVINFDKFITEEIIPQKEFFDTFVERLKIFDKDQFCIFMLCYDIKKIHRNIV